MKNGPFSSVCSRVPTSRLESGKGREPAAMASVPLLPAPSNPVYGGHRHRVPESGGDDIHHKLSMSKNARNCGQVKATARCSGSRRSKRAPPKTRARINAAPRCSEGVDHPFLVSRCGKSQPPTKAKLPANAGMARPNDGEPSKAPPFWAGDRAHMVSASLDHWQGAVPSQTKSVGWQRS